MDGRIELLRQIVDRAFYKRSWHGTTLKGALRGMTADEALWRPAPDRKNVWELLLHAAYWKYVVRRTLNPSDEPAFPRRPRDWPRVPGEPDTKALKSDVKMLQREHDLLRDAIARLDPARLDEKTSSMIYGVAAHDTHHGGQVQLLKRLRRAAPGRGTS